MKTVTFAKRWRDRRNDTTVEEYPAGWTGVISEERASRAVSNNVLDGTPVDAPEPKAEAKTAEPKPKP